MEEAFKEFGRRYYLWAQTASEREVRLNFPRLQLMNCEPVLHYLSNVRTLNLDERLNFTRALVKYRLLTEFLTHELNGEVLTDEERTRCINFFKHPRPRVPEKMELEAIESADPKRFKIKNGVITAILKEEFHKYNLVLLRVPTDPGWVHFLPSGPWVTRTDIEIGGKALLSYWHRITGEKHYQLKGTISIRSWMGISGGAATWKHCVEEQVHDAIKHATAAIVEFLLQVPMLLDNLPRR